MTTVAVIQARMTSSRIPGKVMLPLAGEPIVYRIVERLRHIPSIDRICFSVPDGDSQEELVALAGRLAGVELTRGPEEDILSRFAIAARETGADTICRFWGDCPAIDPAVCQELISAYGGDLKFATIPDKSGYPAGYEVQIIDAECLLKADAEVDNGDARHNFTVIFSAQPERYPAFHLCYQPYLSELNLLLDTPRDYERLQHIFDVLYPINPVFGLADIIALSHREPKFFASEG